MTLPPTDIFLRPLLWRIAMVLTNVAAVSACLAVGGGLYWWLFQAS